MSKKKEELARQQQLQQEISRIRLPRNKESFGIIEQRLGGNRMRVKCLDGKERICRIPGRLKRRLWVRESDLVVVEPWEFGGDEKGDIVFGISTSGRSKNVLKAIEYAKTKGIYTIALTGLPGSPIIDRSDLALVVPTENTPIVQELHISIIHILCDLIEEALYVQI